MRCHTYSQFSRCFIFKLVLVHLNMASNFRSRFNKHFLIYCGFQDGVFVLIFEENARLWNVFVSDVEEFFTDGKRESTVWPFDDSCVGLDICLLILLKFNIINSESIMLDLFYWNTFGLLVVVSVSPPHDIVDTANVQLSQAIVIFELDLLFNLVGVWLKLLWDHSDAGG